MAAPTHCMLRSLIYEIECERHSMKRTLASIKTWIKDGDSQSVDTELCVMGSRYANSMESLTGKVRKLIPEMSSANSTIHKLQQEMEALRLENAQLRSETKDLISSFSMDVTPDATTEVHPLAPNVESEADSKVLNVDKPESADCTLLEVTHATPSNNSTMQDDHINPD
jgi:regulator of replication initiation timing